jgi:hypothetical protein
MFKAFLLVLDPTAAWERILRSRRGVLFVCLTHLVPLVTLTCIAEGFRLARWPRPGDIRPLAALPVGQVVLFEAGQFLLLMAMVFIGAELLKWVGESVRHGRTYTRAFATVAYGLAPFFLLRFLDAWHGVSPWVTWSIGMVLSLSVLYHGVPRMMEPSAPNAFGLYLMSATLIVLTSGLVRLVTSCYLEGRFSRIEAVVSAAAARLPF